MHHDLITAGSPILGGNDLLDGQAADECVVVAVSIIRSFHVRL